MGRVKGMGALTLGFFVLGILLIAIAAFWNWFQVLDESLEHGEPKRAAFYFVSQFYALYYELVHRKSWPHVGLVYGLFLLGCVCLLVAYLVGRRSGVVPP